jgi:succinate dehydrogenase / fumarate reductase, cytochrome b subunit
MSSMTTSMTLHKALIWKRLHSLFGLWIVLFLFEHLLTNSQAALWIGDDGNAFVRMVNLIHNLPYLEAIEVLLIGVPLGFHLVLGIKYLWSGKFNSYKTDGSKPSLPEYGRNRAYSWQRITSWILVFLLLFHVVRFRFLEYPHEVALGKESVYLVKVQMDNGLYTVADRLDVSLYDVDVIDKVREGLRKEKISSSLIEAAQAIRANDDRPQEYDEQKGMILASAQSFEQREEFVKALDRISCKTDEVIAVSKSFGTATLLTVRDTFKNPLYVAIYTIFVLAACYHGFNGFWTFLITWGLILSYASQKRMVKVAIGLMALVTFLGLAAIWGTYWVNLKY